MIGLCKECFEPVRQGDEIPTHPGIYECPKCGHPNSKDELWEATTSTQEQADATRPSEADTPDHTIPDPDYQVG